MTRKFTEKELVIATHNKNKMAELEKLFEGKGIKLLSAADLNIESPEETGTTLLENSVLKAKFVAEATGKVTLADDSGLCVDVLQGAPGVYTADWAETEDGSHDYKMAMEKVHEAMEGSKNTAAHFACVLTLCWTDGHCESVEGIIAGDIVWPPSGDNGFGYDPMFMPSGHTQTYAELGDEIKNKTSHRANALRKLMNRCFS